MPSFDEAHATVSVLANDFADHESKYLAPGYQEAEVRKDFIDKFLIALGWDVNHDIQKNPYEQEVKVERGQQQGMARKRADYAFSIAPNYRDVRFFAEAKKPSVDIANAQDYFQALRYGWNSGNPLVVITDFEQFHILDSRYKPNVDTALNRLVKGGAFHYRDYLDPEKFSRIYWLFSREAVVGGSLEKYAVTLPKPSGGAKQLGLFKDGTQKIDESFLEELDEYRLVLARAFKKTDFSLDGETLTELVQRTLDRLVFIRFLEDRLIEPDYLVSKFGQKDSAWRDFIVACHRLDGIYNGIVFKKHALLDAKMFAPDETAFANICEQLSHLNSPYDFNAIPIHILGNIYERFLGKVIVATAKQVRVVDKPEVRNAGGVFYTPDYIVRYIVGNTVGKLIEGKNPDVVAKLRFADIACGSGSFLLGVFDELLEYHTTYYNKFPKQAQKGECFTHEDGSLHLTLKKRREILLNGIYGVDIDAQAVEVAQLSLYLRLLQDETTVSAKQYQMEFHVTLLPSLSNNIKCGNSLVGMDVLEGQLFEPKEERKLNPMDFENAFPNVMRAGGFDEIVGNPPWGAEFTELELQYHREKHRDIIVRMIDSFMYFVHQAAAKMTNTGRIGMIVPDVLLYQTDNEKLRSFLLNYLDIQNVVNMGDVFHKVTRPACIIVCKRGSNAANQIIVGDFAQTPKGTKATAMLDRQQYEMINQKDIAALPGKLFVTSRTERYRLWRKLLTVKHATLEQVVDKDGIQRGVSPDLKEAFLVDSATSKSAQLEPKKLRKVVTGGKQVKRYFINDSDQLLIYTSRDDDFAAIPNICRYIEGFRQKVTCKEVKQGKHPLYALHRPREERIFLKPQKLLGVITGDKIIVSLDTTQLFATDGLYVFSVRPEFDAHYIMGILNSSLFVYVYRLLALENGRVLAQVKPTILNNLPIPSVNLANPEEKAQHEKIIRAVTQMSEAKRQLATAQSDKDIAYYENKCNALDRQINSVVYELYGLTHEEIQTVEADI